MASHFTFEPDDSPSPPRNSDREQRSSSFSEPATNFQADLADLVAKFSSPQGGGLSLDLAIDLALEVVFHEIVELAALALGASGAAVILERDGEWVCRARHGVGAPDLGTRIARDSELTSCHPHGGDNARDAESRTEPRSEKGFLSLIVVPVLSTQRLAGVCVAFSSRARAFSDSDERTLAVFAQYISSGLAQAEIARSSALTPKSIVPLSHARDQEQPEVINSHASAPADNNPREAPASEPGDFPSQFPAGFGAAAPSGDRIGRIATWTMAAVLVAFTVLLSIVSAKRFLGGTSLPAARTELRAPAKIRSENVPPARAAISAAHSKREYPAATSGNTFPVTSASHASPGSRPPVASGSMVVYEAGKTVFRWTQPAAPRPGVAGKSIPVRDSASAGQVSTPAAIRELLSDDGPFANRVSPEYPEKARLQKIEGQVVLIVRGNRDGNIDNIELVKGNRVLADAAIAAVRQWKFKTPDSKVPPPQQTRVVVNFKLSSDARP